MHKLQTMVGKRGRLAAKVFAATVLFGAALPLFADYAVTAATSQTAPLALYTSAAETPTYAVAAGALATPFLVTYKEGETVSVTSPNGVTTQLSGTDGTIDFNPTSGGVWRFANSNGSTAFVGKGWNGDGFASVSDEGALPWLETKSEGPDRTVKTKDTPSLAYSDASFTGDESGTVTLTLTDPAGTATVYTKEAGKDAEALRLNKSGVWTVVLTTPSGVSTAEITVRDVGFMLIVK